MITIVDYGMGNLGSVAKAFRKIGCPAVVTGDRRRIRDARAVVVPGVGAFGRCMENLACGGLDSAIRSSITAGKPYLGICLGYQILFEASEENPGVRGLGIIGGSVRKFPETLKVPHMGWNTIEVKRQNPLLEGVADGTYLYFVHSYYPAPDSDEVVAATTEYGVTFSAAARQGSVFATQFHPEKSQEAGIDILKNFASFVGKRCS